jgi:hypothetical protein
MKPISFFKIALFTAAVLSLNACIIAPPYASPSNYQTPPPVAVDPVAPAPYYAAPAVGYVWLFHPFNGWGWRHPHHGWHRHWR